MTHRVRTRSGHFTDRYDAGERLAVTLARSPRPDSVVIALPRGGIMLGIVVAQKLHAPLGLVLVKKIVHPFYPEVAVGAIVDGNEPLYDSSEAAKLDMSWLAAAATQARHVNEARRELYFSGGLDQPRLAGQNVIIVDDGIATGLTMEATVASIRTQHPRRITIAVPVSAMEAARHLHQLVDEIIVLDDPRNFRGSVGAHYDHFEQVDDETVRLMIRGAIRSQNKEEK